MRRFLPFAIIILVLGVAVTFALYLSRSVETETAASSPPSAPSRDDEIGPQPGAQPPHEKGPQGAVVTLEEFGDFECPACARFHPIWKSLEPKYGQRIRVTFRHFPIPLKHKRALVAAYAAEAAGLQGKFWEMHDKLFENREAWAKANDPESVFLTYAQELGLDLARFKEDNAGDSVRLRVNLDFQRGRSLKIKGTPTLYLNGVEIPYSDLKTIENFEKLLDEAIKRHVDLSSR
ncbi:MAG TPA: thioredoxin domain-containing protein [Pyrinomonadaceae bacterium]|nr:thioredoxin domain-containing protein [Pyrinomonadaceae bacterium]